MQALQLEPRSVKKFMGQLLREDAFDNFDVRSVEIATTTLITINGELAVEASEVAGETEEIKKAGFSTWGSLRPLVLEIMRLSPKPRYMKIVFSCKVDEATVIHTNAAALFLNLSYEGGNVFFTTGASPKEFVFEKTLDNAWDGWVSNFFVRNGYSVSVRE